MVDAASPGTWQPGPGSANGLSYYILLPDGYTPAKNYPVLLFLHGGGQEKNLFNRLDPWFNTADFRSAYPAIVIAPILENSNLSVTWGGYGPAATPGEVGAIDAVEQVLAQYSGDPNRVYVTGLSLGGHGTWDMMLNYNAYNGTEGRIFAAGIPLSGAPGRLSVSIQDLYSVPIWSVNGRFDGPINDASSMAAALAGSSNFRYSLLPSGHDTWDLTYPLPSGAPYYDWLFSQSANVTGTAVPPSPPIVSPPAVSPPAISPPVVSPPVASPPVVSLPTGTPVASLLGFDAGYYLANNPDVAGAVAADQTSPESHFLSTGWREGRNPDAFFNTNFYLAANPDVKAAGINPLLHYDTVGWKEGRDAGTGVAGGFDTLKYLAANPDVKAAGVNPLGHYIAFGQGEGRKFT